MQQEALRVSPARVFARPAAEHIWLGPQQRTALDAFTRPAPLRVLIGPPDSGKTTLVRHWSAQRDLVLACRGPRRDAAGVLAQLLREAQLTPLGLGETDQRNLFTVFVQQRRSQGRRVFVAVDDADRLEAAAWHEIGRLLAWRFEKRPVLDVLLAGSPALLRALRAVRPFEADSATIVSLAGPACDDVHGYLDWRLTRFALRTELTSGAKDAIADVARGRYSVVDMLAQMAFLLAECRGIDTVGAALVREAVRGARLPPLRSGAPKPSPHGEPRAVVVVSLEGSVVEHVELRGRTVLGRSELNDIALPSPFLSRHHAAIVGTAEGFYVVDLNSKNGFAVNGRKTACAMLADGDVIEVGPYRIEFRSRGGASEKAGGAGAVTAVNTPNPSAVGSMRA